MSEENKRPSDGQENEEPAGKKRITLRNVFYNNTFVLVFSLLVSLTMWFFMSATNTEQPIIVYDVPIQVNVSPNAETDGLKVFNMSYTTVDIEVSGSNLITSKLTDNDFDVSVTLNPTSMKLTGNTLQKVTVPVKVAKKNTIAEYTVGTITPEEVNIEYDRYKEVNFPIQDKLKYSADAGFYANKATLSEETVTISGPESAVNKISRVAVEYTVSNALRSDVSFSCPVRLYDLNNQEITDTAAMYLSLSVDTINVTVPVLARKTVKIVPTVINKPKNFADSRIVVEPEEIEIAGTEEALKEITEITLEDAVDFSELDATKKNVFERDIPIPSAVKNISNLGTDQVSTATVSVNLNGYEQAKVTTSNITISKGIDGKKVDLVTKSLEITLIGSEAQVSKLTGDSVSCQVDLTNFAESNGSVEVPVTVSVSGADSCWSVGKYTVYVSITDKAVALTAGLAPSSGVAATPQE